MQDCQAIRVMLRLLCGFAAAVTEVEHMCSWDCLKVHVCGLTSTRAVSVLLHQRLIGRRLSGPGANSAALWRARQLLTEQGCLLVPDDTRAVSVLFWAFKLHAGCRQNWVSNK